MNSTTLTPLRDLLDVQSGFAFKKDYFSESRGVPLIRIRDLENDATEAMYDGPFREEFLVAAGDYLIGMDGEFRCHIWRGPQALLNQRVCRLRNFRRGIEPRYIYFGIQKYLKDIEDHTPFATVKHISGRQIENIVMPVPTVEGQRRAVDLLSRAENIVRMRREAEQKAKEIIPALFLDMFGDPATNPKGWEIRRLGDLSIKMSDGPFGSNLKSSHYVDEGVRVIRLQNIGVGDFLDDDRAYVSVEHFKTLPRNQCAPGDVVIGTLGDPNLRAMILPASVAEALNKADCVQFRCDFKRSLPEYICWLLNMPSTLVLAAQMVRGVTRTRISMGRLRELQIPAPPLALQYSFAYRVQSTAELRESQRSGSILAALAFQSLLARVFGE